MDILLFRSRRERPSRGHSRGSGRGSTFRRPATGDRGLGSAGRTGSLGMANETGKRKNRMSPSPSPQSNPCAPAAPTPEDLAETPEVQFTPALRQIATLLENDPVPLYEFVRNTFAFEPYYGSVKGSQATLSLQSGNDFDQASVLIALYRQAGIPARYVYGTVEIPIEKAMQWLGGITNPKVVGEVLASNGIPATLIYVGGVPQFVRLEHVWVEAWLPYENYRGVRATPPGRSTWVPLDPSFKLHDPNPNALDLAAAQGFDADSYFTSYLQAVKPRTPAENYLKDSIDYVSANRPGQLFYNLLSSGPISEKVLGLLPNTLAYPIKAVGGRFSTIPDNYRHRVTVEIGLASAPSPDISYVATWTTLLHKRFTLSYEPATAADAQTIAAYGDLFSTPPYLIQVKPILKLEGQTVAEGAAVPMAADLAFRITFSGAINPARNYLNIYTASRRMPPWHAKIDVARAPMRGLNFAGR